MSASNFYTATILLGLGHGSAVFWQVYSAPNPYGFLAPIIVGGLMEYRFKVTVTLSVLSIELAHFIAGACGLYRTGLDMSYLGHAVVDLPKYAFTSIFVFLTWHVVVITLVIKSLSRRALQVNHLTQNAKEK